MRILIATGIYPPRSGGPAEYAKSLKHSLEEEGHAVSILTYGTVELYLPFGLRHLWLFFRALVLLRGVNGVIALDTVSTGLPSILAAKLYGISSTLRIGGDFLWESYVERTHTRVTLPGFYAPLPALTIKERMIFALTRRALALTDTTVFSTPWQRNLWEKPYRLSRARTAIIENAYDIAPRAVSLAPKEKIFLWAMREVTLKNLDLLRKVFAELKVEGSLARLECVTSGSKEILIERIRQSYAVILPSYSDVSPNVVLEGIKEGKPFIMTKHTGIQDRLSGAGYFVDPFNEAEIKSAIQTLCDADAYRKYQEVIRSFTFRHTYDDIAKEFIGLLSRPKH